MLATELLLQKRSATGLPVTCRNVSRSTPPYSNTKFGDGRPITDFAWSRDDRHLAVARASVSSDIVLFKGLKR